MPTKVINPVLSAFPPENVKTCSDCCSPNIDTHYMRGKRILICSELYNRSLILSDSWKISVPGFQFQIMFIEVFSSITGP